MKRKALLCAVLCASVALAASSCAMPETERFSINTSVLEVYDAESFIAKFPSAVIGQYPDMTIELNGGAAEAADGRNAYKFIYSLKDILGISDPYAQLRYKGSSISEETKTFEFHQYVGKTEIFNNIITVVTAENNIISVTSTFDSDNPEALSEMKHTLTHCFDEACSFIRSEYGANVSDAFINNPQTGMYRTDSGYIAAYRFGVITGEKEYVCVVDANSGASECTEIKNTNNEKA